MIILNKPISVISKILGQAKIKKTQYRMFTYVLSYKIDDSTILFNTLTSEMILLTNDEYKYLFDIHNDSYKELQEELIKKYFLVPVDNNDPLLFEQINSMLKLINIQNENTPIKLYTIFPTTDCNARCFYCFENGARHQSMSAKTAKDVAEFIFKKCKGETVTLNWFGGEPLYNLKVIDIICTELTKLNVKYSSRMISNGYLFDNTIINKAKNLWLLKRVQITLDGTEAIYNKTKAYIYSDCKSPFKKVISNIKELLNNDIYVSIRLNLGKHNQNDLEKLIDYLILEYTDFKKLSVNVAILYDGYNGTNNYTNQDFQNLILVQNNFVSKLLKNGLFRYRDVGKSAFYMQCMATDPTATTIMPDGKLGKCEHYLEDNFWGDIYSEKIDYNILESFRKTIVPKKECALCKFYPLCHTVEKCFSAKKSCTELDIYNLTKNYEKICEQKYLDEKNKS